MVSHWNHLPPTFSTSGNGPSWYTREKSHLTCKMTLLHRHYHLHYWGYINQLDSKTCWQTSQLSKCMPSGEKVGLDTSTCGSRLPLIWINKVVVLTCSLLHKVLIGGNIIWLYDVHVTHTKFLDKLCNLLVLLHRPNMESGIRSIFKDASDLA